MIILIFGLIFAAIAIGFVKRRHTNNNENGNNNSDKEFIDPELQNAANEFEEPEETIDMEFPMEGIEEHTAGTTEFKTVANSVINNAPFDRNLDDLRDAAAVIDL